MNPLNDCSMCVRWCHQSFSLVHTKYISWCGCNVTENCCIVTVMWILLWLNGFVVGMNCMFFIVGLFFCEREDIKRPGQMLTCRTPHWPLWMTDYYHVIKGIVHSIFSQQTCMTCLQQNTEKDILNNVTENHWPPLTCAFCVPIR